MQFKNIHISDGNILSERFASVSIIELHLAGFRKSRGFEFSENFVSGRSCKRRDDCLVAERVRKAVSIEGLGVPENSKVHGPLYRQMRYWIESVRKTEKRQPKTYPTIAAAVARMKEANPHLSDEVARHLTMNGTNWESDGSLVWKFDNYARVFPPYGHRVEDSVELYTQIACPVLLFWGLESFFSVPEADRRAKAIRGVRLVKVPHAGHWVHHDQLDSFLRETLAFMLDKTAPHDRSG